MIVSHFSQIFDTVPKPVEYTWPQFVSKFGHHIEAHSKESVAVISPAQWPKGARRKKGEVQNIRFAALDLDKISKSDIDQVKNILQPYSYLLHTTWSHAETHKNSNLWSVRVFIDLSRPVKAF